MLKLSFSTKALVSSIPIILIHKLAPIHQPPHHHHWSSRTIADPCTIADLIHHPPHPLRSPAHLCRSCRYLPQPIALGFYANLITLFFLSSFFFFFFFFFFLQLFLRYEGQEFVSGAAKSLKWVPFLLDVFWQGRLEDMRGFIDCCIMP